jgi:hypothetical protein
MWCGKVAIRIGVVVEPVRQLLPSARNGLKLSPRPHHTHKVRERILMTGDEAAAHNGIQIRHRARLSAVMPACAGAQVRPGLQDWSWDDPGSRKASPLRELGGRQSDKMALARDDCCTQRRA